MTWSVYSIAVLVAGGLGLAFALMVLVSVLRSLSSEVSRIREIRKRLEAAQRGKNTRYPE